VQQAAVQLASKAFARAALSGDRCVPRAPQCRIAPLCRLDDHSEGEEARIFSVPVMARFLRCMPRMSIRRHASATASSGEATPSVEVRVRRVVADCLGTDADGLSAGVSLTDDLAADSLDLVDLAVALEAEFQITVPDMVLDETRTCGDLVDAIDTLVRARRDLEAEREERRAVVRSLLTPPTAMLGSARMLAPKESR
jgi:acyl carrier protein